MTLVNRHQSVLQKKKNMNRKPRVCPCEAVKWEKKIHFWPLWELLKIEKKFQYQNWELLAARQYAWLLFVHGCPEYVSHSTITAAILFGRNEHYNTKKQTERGSFRLIILIGVANENLFGNKVIKKIVDVASLVNRLGSIHIEEEKWIRWSKKLTTTELW